MPLRPVPLRLTLAEPVDRRPGALGADMEAGWRPTWTTAAAVKWGGRIRAASDENTVVGLLSGTLTTVFSAIAIGLL